MPTSTFPRRFSRRWPQVELLFAAVLPLILSLPSCRSRATSEERGRPPERMSERIDFDQAYFEALRLYEEGMMEEATSKLEALAEKAEEKGYPYLGDIYDLLGDCYSALDRPADEYQCLLKALECYKAGGKTRRYPSPDEAIRRLDSYLPLLREQIKAQGQAPRPD